MFRASGELNVYICGNHWLIAIKHTMLLVTGSFSLPTVSLEEPILSGGWHTTVMNSTISIQRILEKYPPLKEADEVIEV